jgi:NADH-quinone oxidoreductase subunit N
MNSQDLISIMPFGIVSAGACLLILFQILGLSSVVRPFVFIVTLVLAFFAALKQASFNELSLNSTFFLNPQSAFISCLIIVAALFCSLLSFGQLERQGVKQSLEMDVLYLFAIAGGLLLACAANMLILFIGFELLSVCAYALCGVALKERASSESALKYFLLGAFASAFLLYGITLVYGATGSFNYMEIAAKSVDPSPIIVIGIAMLIFGFAFKVALVPFHFWTPDVYHGAPTSVTAFMAVVVKIAAFAGFLRLFASAFYLVPSIWTDMLWILAVLSMTVGNILAIQQTSVKRLLAYSSIAHSGYIAMGFLAFSSGGLISSIYYLSAYAMMTISSFGCLLLFTSGTKYQYDRDHIDSLNGVGWTRPGVALAMTISMFALGGMPPLIGFLGKFYLFSSIVESGYTGLAIIAALNSVISLFYYLRVIVAMYFKDAVVVEVADTENKVVDDSFSDFYPGLAVFAATLAVVVIGIYSQPLLHSINFSFK